MRKVLVFVMALSLSVMLLGCSGTDTSKEAKEYDAGYQPGGQARYQSGKGRTNARTKTEQKDEQR